MVGGTEQLFPVSLIVPKESGSAVFQERGFIFGKSGGLLVGKESDPLDMRCFDVSCPMAKPLGVDLYSSLGGLAGGIKPDMVRLSVGIEHIDDILEDIDQALQAAQK